MRVLSSQAPLFATITSVKRLNPPTGLLLLLKASKTNVPGLSVKMKALLTKARVTGVIFGSKFSVTGRTSKIHYELT